MHVTKNYSTDGGDRWVIGGTLEIAADAAIVDPENKIKGADGADGADAPWVDISLPCLIIPAYVTGKPIAGSAEIDVKTYIGAVEKESTVTATSDDEGITADAGNPEDPEDAEATLLLSRTQVTWTDAITETHGMLALSIEIADGPQEPLVRYIPWIVVPTAEPEPESDG